MEMNLVVKSPLETAFSHTIYMPTLPLPLLPFSQVHGHNGAIFAAV